MFTACEKCLTKHQLNMSSVTGPTAKYRCKNCSHINKVSNQALESSENDDLEEVLQDFDSLEPEIHEPPEQDFSQDTQEAAAPPKSTPTTSKPKIKGLSIKAKITMVIVALIVSSLSIVGYIALSRGSKALSDQAETQLALIAGQKAKEYSNVFSRLQDELEGVSAYASSVFARKNITEDLHVKSLMPWTGSSYGSPELEEQYASDILALQRVAIYLKELVDQNPYLELGYIATISNITSFHNDDVVAIVEAESGYLPSKRPWFIDAITKEGTIWTQPYVDVNTKKLVVTCATPVLDKKKKIIGVVGFDVLLNTIQKDIIALDIGYDSQAFLLGKDGSLLAKPGMSNKSTAWNQTVKTDNALETDNQQFKAIIRNMMSGAQGLGSHVEDGDKIIVAYAPLPAIDASVGIVVSQKEVMRPAVEIQKIIIGVWVVVVIISMIIGFLIGNSITKPINDLTMRADLISQGKIDLEEISNKRKDEIGVLIEAYNRLVSSLRIAMSRKRR